MHHPLAARLTPLALTALPLLVGCASTVPPPPPPERLVPVIAMKPPPAREGEGTVIIDVTNGPARVGVVVSSMTVGTTYSSVTSTPVCATTPCAVNLPYGVYNVFLQNKLDPSVSGVDSLQVGEAPSVFRHTMGSNSDSPGLRRAGLTMIGIGASAALSGALMIPLGSISADGEEPLSGLKTAGFVTLGVGGAVGIAGLVMYIVGLPKNQPGSSIQWALDESGPAKGPFKPVPAGIVKQIRLTPAGVQLAFQ